MIKLKWYHYILLSPMILKSAIEDSIKGIEKYSKKRDNQNTITPLHEAVSRSDIKQINELISTGSDVNAKDYRGATPLYRAVELNRLEVTSFLLEKGANPNSINKNNVPVIIEAIKNKNLEMVKLLISRGADPKILIVPKSHNFDKEDIVGEKVDYTEVNNGNSLIYYACVFNPENLKMLNYLVEKGASVNSADEFGYTPFMRLFTDDGKNFFESAKFLIKKGANINARKMDGQTLLHMLVASKSSNFEAIRFLVENGADLNSKDDRGRTLFNEIEDFYDKEENKEIVIYLRNKRK